MRPVPADAAATLRLVLPMLPDAAREVLSHRYGLFGRLPRTREQAAELTGRTVAEVYRIEHAGLDDLRRRLGVTR